MTMVPEVNAGAVLRVQYNQKKKSNCFCHALTSHTLARSPLAISMKCNRSNETGVAVNVREYCRLFIASLLPFTETLRVSAQV